MSLDGVGYFFLKHALHEEDDPRLTNQQP